MLQPAPSNQLQAGTDVTIYNEYLQAPRLQSLLYLDAVSSVGSRSKAPMMSLRVSSLKGTV